MAELESIRCEECGDTIYISEDGTNMVTDCQSFGCPHSDPDREEGDPRPLVFEDQYYEDSNNPWETLYEYLDGDKL